MTIHAVHGWKTTEKIIAAFGALLTDDVKTFNYNSSRGFNLLPRVTMFENGKYGLQLANKASAQECDLLAHSNGCALSLRALRDGANFRRMVWVNPALDRDWALVPFPKAPQLEAVFVLYSEYDLAVKMGRLLVGTEWGDMGAVGPKFPDVRFYGINAGQLGKRKGRKKKQLRHSSILKDPDFWANAVDKLFTEPLANTVNEFEKAL